MSRKRLLAATIMAALACQMPCELLYFFFVVAQAAKGAKEEDAQETAQIAPVSRETN